MAYHDKLQSSSCYTETEQHAIHEELSLTVSLKRPHNYTVHTKKKSFYN